jgi:hypothetical protein
MTQTIAVHDIQFYYSQGKDSVVDPSRVVQAMCRVLFPDGTATPVSASIQNVGEEWLPVVLNVSSLKSGEYHIGVEVRTEEFGSNLTVSKPIDIKHVLEIGAPEIQYDEEDHILNIRDIRVVPSYIHGEVLPSSIILKSKSDNGFCLDLTQEIHFGGGVWYIRDLETMSIVPEGDGYYIEMSFWSEGTLGTYITDTFLIRYGLVVSSPTMVYDPEYDMVQIMGLSIRSEYDEGRLLTETDLAVKRVEVFNSSTGSPLEEYEMYYADGQFYRDVTNPAARYGDGSYYFRATFSTPHSGNYSVTSDPLLLLKKAVDVIPGDDDVPGDEDADESSMGALVIFSILLVLVLVSLIALGIIVLRRRERSAVIWEDDSADVHRVSLPLNMDEIGPSDRERPELGTSGPGVPLLNEASVEYYRPDKRKP